MSEKEKIEEHIKFLEGAIDHAQERCDYYSQKAEFWGDKLVNLEDRLYEWKEALKEQLQEEVTP